MKSIDNHKILLVLLLGMVQHTWAQAQAQGGVYSFVDMEHRITQRAISAIVQDQQGLVWIGAYGSGLYKYYGVDLVSYKQEFNNPKSLNSSLVQTAFVDSSNRLWVGTEVGLNLYDRDLDRFDRIVFYDGTKPLDKLVVRAIDETKSGKILVGTNANGLFEVDPETLVGRPVAMIPGPYGNMLVGSFAKGKDGKIWIGSSCGLFEYDGDRAKAVPLYDKSGSGKIPNLNIESMLIDDSGSLWMGTFSSGLVKIEDVSITPKTVHNYTISDERILTMVQAPDGRILCGTENDGLYVIERNGEVVKNCRYDKFDENSLKSNSIWSLFVDRRDRIWIGYYNKGIGVYDRYYDKFKDIESLPNVNNSLQSSSVTTIVKDGHNRLWIGMDGGGIDVYNLEDKSIVHLIDPDNPIASGLTAVDVQTLFIDSRETLWVGTWNSGIFYLPKNAKAFGQFPIENVDGRLRANRVMSFSEDDEGVLWIGTYSNGLHFYDSRENKFGFIEDEALTGLPQSQAEIRKVLVDSKNTIWVGTTRGVFKRDRTSAHSFSKLDLAPSAERIQAEKTMMDMIVSLYEDSQGNMWIGTDGAGLWKYDRDTQKIDWYNASSTGLAQETIATIIESDSGQLWVAGNKGLSYMDRTDNSFTNFDSNDGLLSNDFNFNAAFKDESGTLYFGNYKGVNIVEPDQIPMNEGRPELFFTDFKIYNQSVKPNEEKSPLKKAISQTDHITLNHKQSVFTIEFVGVNYTRPGKNQYAYYLEGLEESWNFVGNTRSATYTNLSPGDYVFMLKAANNDGVWSESTKTLTLTVLPPWWKTNLAITCYIVLLGLALIFAFRLTRERIREKRMVQVERAKRMQVEELNNRKIQFFTNISHEFRTPLTLIINPLESILRNNAKDISQGVLEKLDIIHKSTNRLKRLIDELMDFRKLQLNKFSIKVSEIELVAFSREIVAYFNEEAALKNIALLFESDKEELKLWSDPGMLEKVLFNILSNAFKITPDNGTITIGVHKKVEAMVFPLLDDKAKLPAVEIYIEDTGSGISQEEVRNIFDRFYQVKNMNSQYYGGTGIGLEVVKSFVDLLKGHITVESEEAVGTKFRVFLPLGKEHFQDGELFLTTEAEKEGLVKVGYDIPVAPKGETPEGQKKTLLIVEDNTELRTYLTNELRCDYSVLEAANGAQGVQIALEHIPDLIITDVVMPEMDGFKFCEAIKEDLKTSHIPILMLTAKTMNEDWVKGIDSGADIYLSKPFDMNVLRAQLKRILKSRQILFEKFANATAVVKIPENTSLMDKRFIDKVMEYIVENIADEKLNVEHLANELNLSRSQLYRKIKALTGLTANEFLRKLRLEKAKEIIENGDASISEVCFKVGFSSPSYFTKCFKAYFGVLPTELKQE
ncbi:two-component regulator propeller domain-containing protein [Pseudozobellia thermophila]|uniref:histidine kinase n=1 Tax=Pseudozobellia thermophila TaxID=192903 RepID=A0A1M6CEY4_9FLAO|nr:two-component regulator propeller domain-containing protein [Pseudozobellia thermophila]SHI59552.1 Signal transduction histidine kinase [Pseudozobellia thermophila]